MRLARVFPFGFTAVLVTIACLTAGVPAAAQGHDVPEPAADARALEDARWQFAEGSAHYERGRYAEALAAFERSQAFVVSPNTSLMIARCLREVGRGPDAIAAFERAEVDGRRRASLGEAKYGATADAAKAENAQLRATLGTITIRVARAAGASVLVDGKPIAVPPTGEATVLHGAGTVSVIVRGASGGEQKQTVTVAKGASVTMDFAGAAAPSAVVGPPPPPSAMSWAVPAAVTAGVLTLAGGAVFTGFGLSSQSTYDDLTARCGASGCGPDDRAQADSGARAQTIANVGLAVSAAAAVATVIFVVIAVSSGGSNKSARARIPSWLGRVDFGGRAGI